MRNKTTDKTKAVCLIRASSRELERMIKAILSEDHTPASDGKYDLLITDGADHLLLSSADGSNQIRVPRPVTADLLKCAALRITDSVDSIRFSADPNTNSAVLGDASVKLTETEFRLYSAILKNGSDYTTAEELSVAVWGRYDRNLCTVYISYLRRKLDSAFGDGTLITSRGKGYRLRDTN